MDKRTREFTYRIVKRETLWKEKHYIPAEKGKGWVILKPIEVKPIDDLLKNFLRRKQKWE